MFDHTGESASEARGTEVVERPRPFLESFIRNASVTPAQPALVWGRQSTTYGQLSAMALGSLGRLQQLGLRPQDPVAILAPKSPASIALILACQMARLRYLIPPTDLAARTLRSLFEQAGCKHVLAPDHGSHAVRGDLVDEVISSEPVAGQGSAGATPVAVESDRDDVSFMLTTSGSTGQPKIVPLTVGAVDRFTDWAGDRFGIQPGKRVLNYSPLNFDVCLLDVWTTLKQAGCVVLVDPDRATSAGYLLDLLAAQQVHVVQAVPMVYRLLVDATAESGLRFDTVEHVIFTGDTISPRCLRELPRLFGRARLYNVYGCTETNDSFIHEVERPLRAAMTMPLGQPLPGVHYLLLGADGQAIEGPGIGELLIATPFQTEGYVNGELNGDKFVHHAGGRHSLRYFRTGDLVRRHEDGSLTLQGRTDFQIKIRGVGVNTEEVERVLLEHEDVLEAAVVAVPDPLAGHRLHAVIRCAAPGAVNSLVLRRHCAERLPRAAIPSALQIVDHALPRTSTGKVDRNAIRRTQTKE